MVLAAMKSMKTSTIAMKSGALLKKVSSSSTTRKIDRTDSTHSLCKLRLAGALVVATAAYLAVSNTVGDLVQHGSYVGSTVNATTLANVNATMPGTVKLSTCGVAKTDQSKKNGSFKSVEDLVMQHSQLGIAASELVEKVAKPIEKVWLREQATVKSASTTMRANCTMPSIIKLTQPLGYTLADSFTNFTQFVKKGSMEEGLNAMKNVTLTAMQNIAPLAAMQNATSTISNSTSAIVKCAVSGTQNVLTSAWNATGCPIKNALSREFDRVMKGPKGGALRFSVNDSVDKMNDIFSHCKVQKNKQSSVAKRFPASHMVNVAAAKTIYNTTVSDGWNMETRVVNGLWTNVLISKGDFVVSLKRDKHGLVQAFANDMQLGEI